MIPEYYLVVDLEATCCDRGTIEKYHMEIIEMGAVMVRANDFKVIDEYQSFVRPHRHPKLTQFCTELTSIRQSDVDAAHSFVEFVSEFKRWLYRYSNFVFCSWGDYDFHQLQQDCNFHRIPNPISAPHLNVKKRFSETQCIAKKLGLAQAVALAGLQFLGTHHRGIDDARNIACLLPFAIGTAEVDMALQRP